MMKKVFIILGISLVLFSCVEEAELKTKEGNGVKKREKSNFDKYPSEDNPSNNQGKQALLKESFELKN